MFYFKSTNSYSALSKWRLSNSFFFSLSLSFCLSVVQNIFLAFLCHFRLSAISDFPPFCPFFPFFFFATLVYHAMCPKMYLKKRLLSALCQTQHFALLFRKLAKYVTYSRVNRRFVIGSNLGKPRVPQESPDSPKLPSKILSFSRGASLAALSLFMKLQFSSMPRTDSGAHTCVRNDKKQVMHNGAPVTFNDVLLSIDRSFAQFQSCLSDMLQGGAKRKCQRLWQLWPPILLQKLPTRWHS